MQQQGRADSDLRFWCSLPGVDDPARVKDIIGQAAQLSIVEVLEGPFKARKPRWQQKGGILPLNSELLNDPRGGQGVAVVLVFAIAGGDWAGFTECTTFARARSGKWETGFTLSQDGGRRFEAVHGRKHRQRSWGGAG